ncbi:MAG TPA: hypothetical protein VFL57_21005 [Bryobacteraceae bacterium]|nr:hypothetical protein [Bryobacteraceae bacterium]
MGLKLDTRTVRDSDYDFGRERFNLVLFSWTMTDQYVQRVVDALKPGGIVVMECGADWVGGNEMLKRFDILEVIRSRS